MLKLDEKARPRSIPNGAENPIWTVLGPCQMGFIASFGKASGSGSRSGTPAAGAGGFRSRRGRRGTPAESPPSGARERKGALLSEGPLGDLEAKPGFEPGVKALQASALPLGHFADMQRAEKRNRPSSKQWSGQRGSNPRPQPWQGCALPTEPCPLAGY